MRLKIAGGCGEHGRNCFYVETEQFSFLVDCGVMAGETGGGNPHLTQEEIKRCRYVFLTHSHADHTAAVPWLLKNGFGGAVIATKYTLEQLPFQVEQTLALEEICADKQGFLDTLHIVYGYSGHCPGSVWYEFKAEDKTLLFSGDYTEDTFVHQLDPVRNRYADMAVVDCAYGYDETPFETYCRILLQKVEEYKRNYPVILMTVPKYGRGLELYQLLKESFPDFRFMGDSHFVHQCRLAEKEDPWFKKRLDLSGLEIYRENKRADIVFVSDPQLRSPKAQEMAAQILKYGYAVMTGTVECGSMSDRLINNGKMSVLRFPVHLNYIQYQKLIQKNQFKEVIPYHSPQLQVQEIYEI